MLRYRFGVLTVCSVGVSPSDGSLLRFGIGVKGVASLKTGYVSGKIGAFISRGRTLKGEIELTFAVDGGPARGSEKAGGFL